jgi:hypothetical protein
LEAKSYGENNLKRLKLAYYIATCIFLFVGIIIYALFNNTANMLLFNFFPRLPFLDTLYTPIKTDSIWAYILLYNAADGFWCLSAFLFIRAIWLTNILWHTIYSSIFISIAIVFEIAQLFVIIPGTFDALDLVFIGLFAFLESIIFYIFIKRRIV